MASGKARVLGSNVVIKVYDTGLGRLVNVGELDSFRAESTSQVHKTRPIGTGMEQVQIKYGGYDLTFKGGKVDWSLANMIHAQDLISRNAGLNPTFDIEQTIVYYDGTKEVFTYNNAVIFGYSINADAGSEVGEEFKGFAPERNKLDLGSVGELSLQIASKIVDEIGQKIISGLANQINIF